MEQYKGFNIHETPCGVTIELITPTGLIYKRAHRIVSLAKAEIDFALKFPLYTVNFPFTAFLAEREVA